MCENLNSATSEVLDFLLAVLGQLAPHGVLIIELRTDGEAASHSPADWMSFQELFRKTASLDSLRSTQLAPSDAHALVEYYLPELGSSRAQVICDRVGYSPFLIEIACLWLEREQVVRRLGTDDQLPPAGVILQNLETFFEGITPQRATVVIDGLIKFWARHPDAVYQQAIVSAAIMDGILPLEWLKVLAAPIEEAEAAHRLMASGLFEYRGREAALRLRHDLLRERCIAFADEKFFVAQKVAERLDPVLEDVYPAGSARDRIAAKLAFRIGDLALAFDRASNAARIFHAQNQLSDASEMWHVAVQAVEQDDWSAPQRDQRLGRAMLARLEVENDRNRLQQNENEGRLQALESHLSVLAPLNEHAELVARFHLLRWRRFFLLERFDDAYAATTTLQQTVGLTDDVQAQILSALAMNHKGAGNKAGAQAQFDEAVQRFPHIGFLRRNSLSNQAASYLDSAPERAIAAYAEISELLKKEAIPPLRESLHLEVDFAMAHFLTKDYAQALQRSEQATAAALSNAFGTQEARARNIAACCHWQRGDLLRASNQIEMAVFAAERSYYHRFLWRMRVNAAGIAADCQDWQAACRHAEAAVRDITGPRLMQFANPDVRRQRWYAGLLAALHALDKGGRQQYCAEMIQRLRLSHLDADLQALKAGAWPADVFDGRNYVHAERVMITG